ncbi:hypothetical protein CTZ24_09645 [Pantoea phytobeneficialis]|nr:hypothetical protein CTZ24_09645 [Pantoea phytobeneficialis]
MPALSLAELGPRICILGPSNSGKSTLAHAIAQKTSLPLVHLDQLYHLPNTHWQARSEAEFLQLHQAAVAEPNWEMFRYLLLYTRSKQPRNREMFASWQQPKLLLSSAAELQACYQAWGLTR